MSISAHAAHAVPTGPAFDVVLLLHVVAVLVGLGTVVVSAVQAARLLAAAPGSAAASSTAAAAGGSAVPAGGTVAAGAGPPPVRSEDIPAGLVAYFAPGVNWAGRVLYAVPVLGFALLALSGGAFGTGDAWVQVGLGLWVAATLAAEGVLWPAERRIQALLAAGGDDAAVPAVRRAAAAACLSAAGVVVALVAATVVMVAQP